VDSPLIETDRLRVDDAGVAAIDGLTLATTATRTVILGAARALFEAASGMRPIAHGSLRVLGVPVADAVAEGLVAGAPLDVPLPPDWTARAYIVWSARLAGKGKDDANALARDAIDRLKIGEAADALLKNAPLPVRRATSIAAAIATGARAIFMEDPLVTLPEELARPLGQIIVAALANRAWALFAPRLAITSPIALHAGEAIVVAGAEVAAQGAPSELATRDRSYALAVHGDADALKARLEEGGARVDARSPAPPPRRLVVDLGPNQTTRDVLSCAESAGAVIVELRPLARAFA
jgi:ABC-type multidrug transport system ATPase subunit